MPVIPPWLSAVLASPWFRRAALVVGGAVLASLCRAAPWPIVREVCQSVSATLQGAPAPYAGPPDAG